MAGSPELRSMVKYASILIILLALNMSASAERLKAKVVSSGTYSFFEGGGAGAGYRTTAYGDSLKLSKPGKGIEGTVGTVFGFVFRLNTTANRAINLGLVWEHPEYSDPKTGKTYSRQRFRETVEAGYNQSAIIFKFEHPWEIAEGTWTATLVDEDGYPLIRESFEIKRVEP